MVTRVSVSPELYSWAIARSRTSLDVLESKFPKLALWTSGDENPTLKQLEKFANATHAPLGYLLLAEPPSEGLPVADYRTIANTPLGKPSANLFETIYLCEQRQDWYREFARTNGDAPIPFVGSLSESLDPKAAAESMRELLGFGLAERTRFRSWTEAISRLSESAEDAGLLIMISGVVGSDNHRPLDPEEFRGFSLVDEYAPTIFINGADTKAAQIFTLAHELAHIWLGKPSLDDASVAFRSSTGTERWCNQVAAELLVPMDAFLERLDTHAPLTDELKRMAGIFRVSTLVILRRIFDANRMTWDEYEAAYRRELRRVMHYAEEHGGSGGNFYNTTPVRASKRFTRAVIESAREGQTMYVEATRLLGFKNLKTFDRLGERLGVG